MSALIDLAEFLGWTLIVFLLGWWTGRMTLGTFRERVAEYMLINRIEEPGFMPFSFHLINNVTVNSSHNKSSRINHILVCIYGIFVIQVNNRKGFISRSAISERFVQTLGKRGGYKIEFNSPIMQNLSHILSLNEFLHLPQSVFHNLVVFTGDCRLLSDFGEGVICLSMLKDYFNKPREAVFDNREIAAIVGLIEMHRRQRSLETDEQHKNAIREYIG